MGKQGKRKWEIEFDTLSAMNIDDEIAKLEGKGKTKEEYKANKNKIEELKAFKENKLKAFKENKPKIERLRAFRDKYEAIKEKLTNENNTLKSEMQSLQTSKLDLIKLQAEQTKIDEEHKILAQKRIEIEEKIKNATTDEERESLRLEFENNEKKIINNDNRFIANQNSLKSKLENQQRDPKAIQKKIEENEKKIKNASEIISKCNMICHAILEGKSWDDIEVKLAEWQHAKFRGKAEPAKAEPAKAEPKKLSREASFYQKIAEGEALKAARDKANQTAKEKGDPWRGR